MFFAADDRGARRSQLRLAGVVRRHARIEGMRGRRAGVVDFAALRERAALWEQLAEALGSDDVVDERLVTHARALLAGSTWARDYGVLARDRNERIGALVEDVLSSQRGRAA